MFFFFLVFPDRSQKKKFSFLVSSCFLSKFRCNRHTDGPTDEQVLRFFRFPIGNERRALSSFRSFEVCLNFEQRWLVERQSAQFLLLGNTPQRHLLLNTGNARGVFFLPVFFPSRTTAAASASLILPLSSSSEIYDLDQDGKAPFMIFNHEPSVSSVLKI